MGYVPVGSPSLVISLWNITIMVIWSYGNRSLAKGSERYSWRSRSIRGLVCQCLLALPSLCSGRMQDQWQAGSSKRYMLPECEHHCKKCRSHLMNRSEIERCYRGDTRCRRPITERESELTVLQGQVSSGWALAVDGLQHLSCSEAT